MQPDGIIGASVSLIKPKRQELDRQSREGQKDLGGFAHLTRTLKLKK